MKNLTNRLHALGADAVMFLGGAWIRMAEEAGGHLGGGEVAGDLFADVAVGEAFGKTGGLGLLHEALPARIPAVGATIGLDVAFATAVTEEPGRDVLGPGGQGKPDAEPQLFGPFDDEPFAGGAGGL